MGSIIFSLKLLHFTHLFIRLAKLFKVELYCDFLFNKSVMQLEKIVDGDKWNWVYIAVSC